VDLGKHVPPLVLAPVVGLGAAISSAADLIEEEAVDAIKAVILGAAHDGE
jgi:hypothetical protein